MGKYYEGHNMMTGGAVISKEQELADKVKWVQNVHGNIINPFAAFMILQTSKTMALRVKQQSENAMAIAEFLEKHPKVTKVNYPGLASHPQKDIADKYYRKHHHCLRSDDACKHVEGGPPQSWYHRWLHPRV